MPLALYALTVGAFGIGVTEFIIMGLLMQVSADLGVSTEALSEAIRFAQAAGLDLAKVLEAISGGAAQSWQMVNRWPTMAAGQFDFGFAIDWMRKDLAIALGEGGTLGVSLPVTALVDQFYAELQAMGAGRQDTSALIRRLPKGTAK